MKTFCEQCRTCKIIARCIERQPSLRRFILKSYGNGGIIYSYPAINTSTDDYKRIFSVADFFAMQGKAVVLAPKFDGGKFCPDYDEIYGSLKGTKYYGKCPDLSIDGIWYEHEGFTTTNPKRAFSNMLNHGLKQYNRIIIEDCGLSNAYMRRIINNRISEGQDIIEVWIKGRNTPLYKKSKE